MKLPVLAVKPEPGIKVMTVTPASPHPGPIGTTGLASDPDDDAAPDDEADPDELLPDDELLPSPELEAMPDVEPELEL